MTLWPEVRIEKIRGSIPAAPRARDKQWIVHRMGACSGDDVPMVSDDTSAPAVAQLRASGGNDFYSELVSLRAWLAHEDDLRNLITVARLPIQPGQMGTLADVLSVTLGSGGAAIVLASSLATWLKQRHADVSVEVQAPDGRSINVTAVVRSSGPPRQPSASAVDLAWSAPRLLPTIGVQFSMKISWSPVDASTSAGGAAMRRNRRSPVGSLRGNRRAVPQASASDRCWRC